MHSWRITKYNPIFRDKNGFYLKNEWTAFSDIGQLFENKKLAFEEYIKTKTAYISAILLFFACNKLSTLMVMHLEKNRPFEDNAFNTKTMAIVFNKIEERLLIKQDLIEVVARLVLREAIWCKLESEKMYVHFGWDYYMYIGSNNFCKKQITDIEQSGLFVEKCPSPYR